MAPPSNNLTVSPFPLNVPISLRFCKLAIASPLVTGVILLLYFQQSISPVIGSVADWCHAGITVGQVVLYRTSWYAISTLPEVPSLSYTNCSSPWHFPVTVGRVAAPVQAVVSKKFVLSWSE